MMNLNSIKNRFSLNVSFILLMSMLLTDVVIFNINKKNIINSAISNGDVVLSSVSNVIKINGFSFSEVNSKIIHSILIDSGIFDLVILTENNEKMQFDLNRKYDSKDHGLVKNTKTALVTGKRKIASHGTTFGVLQGQNATITISQVFTSIDSSRVGIGVVIPVDSGIKTLIQDQKLILLYIILNTIVFTLIASYQLSQLMIRPIKRLVTRVEKYEISDELVYFKNQEKNEFGRLSNSLNNMLGKLSDDKDKLKSVISDLKKANQELGIAQNEIIRAEKLASVGRLTAGIAHEIGNPVGIVLGYIELLKQENLTDDEKNDYLSRTEKETQRINRIIRQLLDFSRKSEQEESSVSIHYLIQDIQDIFKVQPGMLDIKLDLQLNAEKDNVLADQSQLHQVFYNLILNAADSISDGDGLHGTMIRIVTKQQGSDIHIKIHDSGTGIPEEDLDKIFDPFYTTKEPGKGTGLGLYVSYVIIDNLGGKIKAENRSENGSVFTVELPIVGC